MVSLGDFFRISSQQNHVLWDQLSLWKWLPGISPAVKAASAFGWRPTTLVVTNVKKIQGPNLPGTPWATLASCRMPFTFAFIFRYLNINEICRLLFWLYMVRQIIDQSFGKTTTITPVYQTNFENRYPRIFSWWNKQTYKTSTSPSVLPALSIKA